MPCRVGFDSHERVTGGLPRVLKRADAAVTAARPMLHMFRGRAGVDCLSRVDLAVGAIDEASEAEWLGQLGGD